VKEVKPELLFERSGFIVSYIICTHASRGEALLSHR